MTRQKGRCLHVGREGRDIRAIPVDDESGRTMDRTTPMEVVGSAGLEPATSCV